MAVVYQKKAGRKEEDWESGPKVERIARDATNTFRDSCMHAWATD
jgi:hypothetical protein